MTPDERILLRTVNLLVIQWQFASDRETYLVLIEDALKRVPSHGWVAELVDAGQAMVAARSDVAWSQAVHMASQVVAKILRSDLAAAIVSRTAQNVKTTG